MKAYTFIASDSIYCLDRPAVARIYNGEYWECLLSGRREYMSKSDIFSFFNSLKVPKKRVRVFHFFFEWGYFLYDLLIGRKKLIIHLEYCRSEKVNLLPGPWHMNLVGPSLKNYKKMFDRIQGHLVRGDCYQANLTSPFSGDCEGSPKNLMGNIWNQKNRGGFGHATSIENDLYISNSPEELFSVHENVLTTRPIKGTISQELGKNVLKESSKDQAELAIIIDLLRNDLTKIEGNVPVLYSWPRFFKVPLLYHQYAKISVPLDSLKLGNLLLAMFPGGSVTGAPKKRVLEILLETEKWTRGFYCGSTLVWSSKILCASLNIRSGIYKCGNFIYGAGGGITLGSRCFQEWEEMKMKTESFTQAAKLPFA